MREGVDFAWGRLRPSELKLHGKSFVIRYVSTSGNPKNISKSEAQGLLNAGIDVGIVFETTTGRALQGFAAGVHDAGRARDQVVAAGGPKDGGVIYFAVDIDTISAGERGRIAAYLDGCAHVLGKNKVGVYGEYDVIEAMVPTHCKYGWQTYAWSRGHVSGKACLYQYNIFAHVGALPVDLDRALRDDFGQWFYEAAGPVPGPYPEDPYWVWLRWQLGEGEFKGHGADPKWRPLTLPAKVPKSWWLKKLAFLAARKR